MDQLIESCRRKLQFGQPLVSSLLVYCVVLYISGLIRHTCTLLKVCACLLLIHNHQQWTDVGQASTSQVMRLSVAYGPWNRPCDGQLPQFEDKVLNHVDAGIHSLRVLIRRIGMNGLQLSWQLMRHEADWPQESTRNFLCYCEPHSGVLSKTCCFRNLLLAILDDFSFLDIATHLWPIGFSH